MHEALRNKLVILLGPLKIENSVMSKTDYGFKFTCTNSDYASLPDDEKKQYYLKVIYALNQVFTHYNVDLVILEKGEVTANIQMKKSLVW